MNADHLLDGLDPEQRDVAQALRGPVCVVAGAGTGKTRAITHRIAYGVATGMYQPSEVLAVTFTTRAAGEMRTRLNGLGTHGVQARTFHSAALRQARYFWPHVYGGQFPQIVQSKFGLVAETVRQLGMAGDNALIRDLAAEIEWAKVTNTTPAAYLKADRQVADLAAADVAAVLSGYEEVKRERERIDMEDILLVTAAILADNEAIAAQVRRQYKWFVVDEFQDVNPLQSMLLDLWLGGRADVCVVGDPRQTIYTFAGASPGILRDFTSRHPDAQKLELVRNYRSTPQVIAAANTVFRGREGVQLVSQNESGPPVSYVGHPDESAEAAAVASQIAALHRDGVAYKDMAVLFRINAQSEAFEEALGQALIPFTLRGVEGFFHRAEVRQAVTLLRGAARAGEGSGQLLDDVRAVLAAMGHTDDPPAGAGQVRDRWESLHAIVSMAGDLPPGSGLTELVADLDRRSEQAHAPVADGVTLATLHAAKGLEWDAVFCVGMHESMMPIVHADTPAKVEEERRLFYVGITRAKRHLSVSWSATRNPGGRGNRKPTRFLDGLVVVPETAPRSKKRKVTVDLDPADMVLFEKLRAWRKEQADELSVPAFVVFTDATLQGIAREKPTSAKELLGIVGVGRSKLEKFGEQVLSVVGEAGE